MILLTKEIENTIYITINDRLGTYWPILELKNSQSQVRLAEPLTFIKQNSRYSEYTISKSLCDHLTPGQWEYKIYGTEIEIRYQTIGTQSVPYIYYGETIDGQIVTDDLELLEEGLSRVTITDEEKTIYTNIDDIFVYQEEK